MPTTNTRRSRQIPPPPCFSGPGHNQRRHAWKEDTLYDLTPAEQDILDQAATEAIIAWNMTGGSSSGHQYFALCKAIRAINEGTVPNFPMTRRNDEMIAREKLKREMGIEADVEGAARLI